MKSAQGQENGDIALFADGDLPGQQSAHIGFANSYWSQKVGITPGAGETDFRDSRCGGQLSVGSPLPKVMSMRLPDCGLIVSAGCKNSPMRRNVPIDTARQQGG